MPGRKAKPIGLHLVQGNKSHLTKKEIKQRKENEVKPPTDNIERPDFLKYDPIAQREWRRLTKELLELGLLTNIDTTALAVYCDAYSKYVEATEAVKREGVTIKYTNKAGHTNTIENPNVNVAKKYYKIMKDMMAEFGLTPAARAKLAIPKEERKEPDPFERDFGNL
jgi:P27 family predicted phage terminase small subunit